MGLCPFCLPILDAFFGFPMPHIPYPPEGSSFSSMLRFSQFWPWVFLLTPPSLCSLAPLPFPACLRLCPPSSLLGTRPAAPLRPAAVGVLMPACVSNWPARGQPLHIHRHNARIATYARGSCGRTLVTLTPNRRKVRAPARNGGGALATASPAKTSPRITGPAKIAPPLGWGGAGGGPHRTAVAPEPPPLEALEYFTRWAPHLRRLLAFARLTGARGVRPAWIRPTRLRRPP
jgi:hypothetical protein